MASARLRQFDRQLRQVIIPRLADEGFSLAQSRIFTRSVPHEGTTSEQIIEFQIGVKRLSGRFTVNLAVFNREFRPPDWPVPQQPPRPADCLMELTQRLGFLRPPPAGLLAKLLSKQSRPTDFWWPQSEDEQRMRGTMEEVTVLIISRGLPWLDERADTAHLREALGRLEDRRRGSARRPQDSQDHV